MQGTLSEIDIRSILQLIELGQRTGELFVEAYLTPVGQPGLSLASPETRAASSFVGHSWFVFFLNGQIVYATSGDGSQSRLRDYLRRYRADDALDGLPAPASASFNAPEYGYLWALLENHILSPAQGRSIIQSMVRETLFDLLSLHQGSFMFELGTPLAPQLMNLEIGPLVAKIMKQIQEWKQLHPHIHSPNQCPVLADTAQLRDSLPEQTFATLDRYADGNTSLRQIARYLNRDILTVARAIYPYIQRGLIQLTYPVSPEASSGNTRPYRGQEFGLWPAARVPRVVCVDDSVSVGKVVEEILNRQGYEVTAIDNPLKALGLTFQLKPDLILCDIAMPELDGYEICAMLRKSTAFRQIPIVMLTGKDGFIDRVKARMVGATDYLTKPFGESELLMLVEKYVGPGQVDRPDLHNSSVDELENELKVNIT